MSASPALQAVLPLLTCPHCAGPLRRDDGPVRCPSGHSFDVAKQGYLNLLTGAGTRGLRADDAEMVAARDRVQSAGVFASVANALVAALREFEPPPGALVDLGGGTGYYAAACLAAGPAPAGADPTTPATPEPGTSEPASGGDGTGAGDSGIGTGVGRLGTGAGGSASGGDGTGAAGSGIGAERLGIGLDLSRHAARRAARAHPRLASVVADAWSGLPLGDGVAGIALCVFAPRNPAELARILTPRGVLAVVTPRAGHLAGIADLAGAVRVDPGKSDRLAAQLQGWRLRSTRPVEEVISVSGETAADLLLMGPAAWHVDRAATRSHLSAGGDVDTRLAVDITLATPPEPR